MVEQEDDQKEFPYLILLIHQLKDDCKELEEMIYHLSNINMDLFQDDLL
eukprot:CAMPEP_0174819614 /NCGR_PEP_ID=MMETSP1107-20130205/2961_1 /TAXON_ID=36770 /ORGANISM="Paraphysomonas vestita, Strain GFlagA" /LENGTH=48 /DNA_ID= /DNA_START= /DNA_END= /DNA_ORIENTATION=